MKKLFFPILIVLTHGLVQTIHAQSDTSLFFTSFDGVKIHYEVNGTGKPVILVHGFIANGESWKRSPLLNDLVKSNHKVITLDMRGNGKSDKPHTAEAYANDAEAKDIMLLADKLKLDNYAAVGYSRGSIIVARLLVLDKRVSKAVMGGMGLDFTNPEWPRRKMFYRALAGDTVKELEGMVKYVQSSGLDQQALAYLQKEQPSTSQEALKKVNVPVLVICGTADSDNGSAAELVKIFQKGIFKTVPGDHNNASRSQEFSNAVVSFLQ
jgi:pimeloyl-ACP methyl ester carboxylesterase